MQYLNLHKSTLFFVPLLSGIETVNSIVKNCFAIALN